MAYIAISFHLVVVLTLTGANAYSIGVCYGLLGDNLLPPKEVVSLYKSHRIRNMRLYEPNYSIFHALFDSEIQVLVGINDSRHIKSIAVSYHNAQKWVSNHIKCYWPNVTFRYIAVGNEAIPGPDAHYVYSAIKNLHKALRNAGLLEYIKVSTVVGRFVLDVTFPPSAASFSNDTIEYMKPIIRLLAINDAPLFANIYPYLSYSVFPDCERLTLNYAVFRSNRIFLQDGDFEYRNLFDEMLDGYYVALEKVGAPKLRIVVSETGWPVYKDQYYGTISAQLVAQWYNSNLIKHILSVEGTPRRTGSIEIYLYAMFHENRKPGPNTTYWGLFNPKSKQPIYPIQFE